MASAGGDLRSSSPNPAPTPRAVTAGTGPILRNPFSNYIFQWPLSGFCVLAGIPPSRQTLTQERKRIAMSPPPLSFSQAPVSLSTGKRDYFLISGKSPKPNFVPVGKPGGPPPSSPNAAGRLSVQASCLCQKGEGAPGRRDFDPLFVHQRRASAVGRKLSCLSRVTLGEKTVKAWEGDMAALVTVGRVLGPADFPSLCLSMSKLRPFPQEKRQLHLCRFPP